VHGGAGYQVESGSGCRGALSGEVECLGGEKEEKRASYILRVISQLHSRCETVEVAAFSISFTVFLFAHLCTPP
jgi:hypothetical protein